MSIQSFDLDTAVRYGENDVIPTGLAVLMCNDSGGCGWYVHIAYNPDARMPQCPSCGASTHFGDWRS